MVKGTHRGSVKDGGTRATAAALLLSFSAILVVLLLQAPAALGLAAAELLLLVDGRGPLEELTTRRNMILLCHAILLLILRDAGVLGAPDRRRSRSGCPPGEATAAVAAGGTEIIACSAAPARPHATRSAVVAHVRPEAGLPRTRSVSNASRCNMLGSVALTLDELRQITNNFSDDQLLGEGAFGMVYKGVLKNGDIIAVKRLKWKTTGLQDVQYENEARHLMRLKHPNIVQLVDYCSETEMKLVRHNGTYVRAEEIERLLCLEYLQKGSLRGHLSDESSGLDWNTRYKIIEGICYGLRYLHEEWQATTPIIHMDLKPENILLDGNMVPKIADFGLSRLFGEDQTRTCTTNCKGTRGYMAPEYIDKGVITKKFDIFSLGVMLLEIITGRRDYPIDETQTTSQQYIDTVLNNWRHRLTKAQGYTSHDIDYQQIKKCIHIGLDCVKKDLVKRPTIDQIIKMLERSDEAYQNERECFRLVANQERIAANGSNTNMRLCFLNGLEPPVYMDENLTSQNDAAIKLAMFEGDKLVTSGALSEAKIEILVLRGDFSNKCRDNWTEGEFDKHIVQGPDRHNLVLGTVWLTNGMVELSQIHFREGSCRKNVIMAARVCKNEKTSGRVQEAIMKPVKVLNRRNKPNEKRHPPRLDDDLYRLEEIARDGAYHRRLLSVQIYKVEGFLKALNEDSNKLRTILKMENQQKAWSKLIEHARECVLEDRQELKRYHSKEGNVVLFFNCVHELVGGAFPNEYVACQRFNTAQKALVNKWRWHAYEKLKDISPDFAMKGNIPEPYSPSTDVAAAPSVLAVGASQQIFSANQLAPYQGTGAAEYLAHDEHVMEPVSQIAQCGPTIPNGPNTCYYQGTGTAEDVPQEEHGTLHQIADCGPIVFSPFYINTGYCQGEGIPLHGQQEVISPWPHQIEFAGKNFNLHQCSSGASTSAQLKFGPHHPPQPGSTSPAAAPPSLLEAVDGSLLEAVDDFLFGCSEISVDWLQANREV